MTKLRTQTLELAGNSYKVREMKGTERFKVVDIQEKEGNTGIAGFILKRCIIEPEKLDWDNEPSWVCDRIVNAVIKLSELGPSALEDAEKKSGAALSEESGTG